MLNPSVAMKQHRPEGWRGSWEASEREAEGNQTGEAKVEVKVKVKPNKVKAVRGSVDVISFLK